MRGRLRTPIRVFIRKSLEGGGRDRTRASALPISHCRGQSFQLIFLRSPIRLELAVMFARARDPLAEVC